MSFSHLNHSEMTKYFLELTPPHTQAGRNIPIPTEILAEQIKIPFTLTKGFWCCKKASFPLLE